MSNFPWLRYEWIWEKSRATGFLDAKRAPLRAHENVLVFCDRSPPYHPQFEKGKPYKSARKARYDANTGRHLRAAISENPGFRYPAACCMYRPSPTLSTTPKSHWRCLN